MRIPIIRIVLVIEIDLNRVLQLDKSLEIGLGQAM